ncbi:MAG: 3-deoxy-D-manno-octulosonic acid transferase [Coraliomargaritaceae bacterium]
MILFYRIIFIPLLLLVLPYYGWRMLRRGGYGKGFWQRFGYFPHLPSVAVGKQRIWLQAVSVGEVLAVGPLIQALQQNHDVEIVLTTTTSTGFAEARKRYQEQVLAIGLFPIDFWFCSALAWRRIQPDAVILTESELWPEHLYRAKLREVPAFLVNARVSDKSFARYQKIRLLAEWLLGQLVHIYAASQHDQERLLQLGATPERTVATGSIKLDVDLGPALKAEERCRLRESLGFATGSEDDCFVLVGASTWPGEEAALLTTQQALIGEGIDCRLLLVPRHAERAREIVRLLEGQGLSWHQRTSGATPAKDLRIHLADTTGELTSLLQAADLAFVGKSLPPNQGGQTPIEAAGMGIPVLMGPEMKNFKAVVAALLRHGAAHTVRDEADLWTQSLKLAKDPEVLSTMSAAGKAWHERNRGSSERIAISIRADLQYSDPVENS